MILNSYDQFVIARFNRGMKINVLDSAPGVKAARRYLFFRFKVI
jgi:hypothetical protein